mmetsp:Transcript_16741/g.26617  ORF Transcript_16741/g.26617 Transcript_16741/m.26617 type:complete len:252 (+) Transcript_16741:922-1677(+)
MSTSCSAKVVAFSGTTRLKRPISCSFLLMRSTMISFTNGSTPAFSHNLRKASLSISFNSLFLSSAAICANALSTPSLFCQWISKRATRSGFDFTPLAPMLSHSLAKSPIEEFSSSAFFLITTALIFASWACLSARALASCLSNAFIITSLLPVAKPFSVARLFNSSIYIDLSSFVLSILISCSRLAKASSGVISSCSTSSSSSSGSTLPLGLPTIFEMTSSSASAAAFAIVLRAFRFCTILLRLIEANRLQ